MDSSNENETPNKSSPAISLELGDIIELISPANDPLHENSFYIKYIDNQHIKLVNISTLKDVQLNIDEDGKLTDESIIQINLLSRSDEKGYARQNNLLPKTWITIHVGGDIPTAITGEISNLEEDMIEIITYPELKTIYIDFKYQGIPIDIPIEKILIREKPASLKTIGSLSMIKEGLEEGEEYEFPDEELASIEFTDSGESIINIPEGKELEPSIRDVLQDLYVDADTVIDDGEDLGEISQVVEVSSREQRFGIDVQVNDMMDELLSVVPSHERTKRVMENIHNLIDKYKSLRQTFSKFDDNQNIYDVARKGDFYKPLVQHIMKLNMQLKWLLPVVKLRRKLHDVTNSAEIADIVSEKTTDSLKQIETIQTEYYVRNADDASNDYSLMQKRIQELMSPFDTQPEDCIYNTQVLTDIDAIVDNLDDFNSTVYTKSGISKRQYVIQRYNMGLSKLDNQLLKSGKTVYTRSPMTPNDNACIKSLITMPIPIVRFSALQWPSTSILDRSSLHQQFLHMFRVLRKNTDIVPHVISDLDKEMDYDKMESETKKSLLDGIHEFILDDGAYLESPDRFERFIESIIPQTRNVIRILRKYMKHKLSFTSVVQQLEPFMIHADDITYAQYKEIRFFIKEQIKTLKVDLGQQTIAFDKIKNTQYGVVSHPNIILRMLAEKKDIADSFFQVYNLIKPDSKDTVKMTPHEMLVRMIHMDTGTLYMQAITSMLISLITPENLMEVLKEPIIDDMKDAELVKPADCATRFLAKKYTSVKDLQRHNNIDDVFVDKEFDDTPYELLDKYKDEQNKLSPDLFLEFFVENLVQKHGVSKEDAGELAKTIISKKRLVVDGNYAVLEIKPHLKEEVDKSTVNEGDIDAEANARKKIQYFRRLKDNWVADNEIKQTSFVDTHTLFCNMNQDCFYNSKGKICETPQNARIRMKATTKDEMVKEFDKRYQMSVEEFEKELETKLAYHVKVLKRNNMLRGIRAMKPNNLAYELGKLANTDDILGSPHIELRELILGQDNFVKKQTDICKFVTQYGRMPMVEQLDESPHWYYCIDTNTKLFPMSIYELANTFASGGDYRRKQDELCATLGVMSDDGDSIVDKESGYVIRKIDFSEEEGFDEAGFRITSHSIMEKDLGETYNANKKEPVYDNDISEMVYNIANTLSTRINVHFDNMESFVLRVSNELIDKHMLIESAYARRNEAMIKKTGKSLGPYEKYRNEIIIIITCSVLFVGIQTAIPSFSVSRVFPGCVKSFAGYPMTGIEDVSGIHYMSCVMNKVKSSIKPWDSLQKLHADKIHIRMKDTIENYVMKRSDIEDLYVQKQQYLRLNPDVLVPQEHDLSKWHHFMPPSVPINIITALRPITGDFKTELMETIKKGNSTQTAKLMLLKSRISAFGYGIVELVNSIVKEKDALLQTSGGIPFLENACCNDSIDLIKPMVYFNENNNNIKVLLQKVRSMVGFHNTIRELSYTPSFFHAESTRLIHPQIPAGRLEENIYAAVIYYCNFDKKLPIPDDLTSICSIKPPQYKSSWSLLEKMEFMKRNGKQYNIDTLNQLMTIVNQRNLVPLEYDPHVNIVHKLEEMIEHLDRTDSSIIDEPLREHLRNVVNEYNPKQMHDTDSAAHDNLTDYLLIGNQRMFKRIMEYFDNYGNMSNTEFNKVRDFLANVTKWGLDSQSTHKENIYDNGLYVVTEYMQNIMVMLSRVYPELLINNASSYKYIPKHWGLADDHVLDIEVFLNKYHSKIETFRGDITILHIVQEVSRQMIDMNLFIKSIPVQTEIQREIINEDGNKQIISFYSLFSKSTMYSLFTYCFYTMLSCYMNISDEPNIIREENNASKLKRREHNKEVADVAVNMAAIPSTTEAEDDTLAEVQIYTDTINVELKTKVAALLHSYIQVEMNDKKETNYTYDDVMKKVNMAKEREKKGFIDYLGKMSIENRKAEDLMKKYRLGKWNVGQQRGLVHYDKETYTRERGEMLSQLGEDMAGNVHDVVNEMRREIYDMDNDDTEDANEVEDREAMDIRGLGDDYDDGVFYEEDRDEEYV